jgi:hypothetical protein
MASVRFTDVQARPTEFLDVTTPHSLYKDPKSLISWGCSESWVEMYFQTMT